MILPGTERDVRVSLGHLLRVYYVPGTILRVLQTLCHFLPQQLFKIK